LFYTAPAAADRHAGRCARAFIHGIDHTIIIRIAVHERYSSNAESGQQLIIEQELAIAIELSAVESAPEVAIICAPANPVIFLCCGNEPINGVGLQERPG
jgi:hypothetical protein